MQRRLRIAWFVHSVRSDWNNGNAHFLRGLGRALGQLGHEVTFFEPANGWSFDNLMSEELGSRSLEHFDATYSDLCVRTYDPHAPALREHLKDTDVVIVHEWNDPKLVELLLSLRNEIWFRMLFHDTHHRASSTPEQIAQLQILSFDGVLAFGEALREIYRQRFHIDRVWTLHEAADTTVFYPREAAKATDVIWIGNWGDNERTKELREFLICPAARLPELRFTVYGVRYPREGLDALSESGIHFGGYLPNLDAPEIYSTARMTIHVPRQQYSQAMTGIPTIRVFEALASGIPLISAPWEDTEHLFCSGDFACVRDTDDATEAMQYFTANPAAAQEQAERGLRTVLSRHTCRHRAEQLTEICEELLTA